MPSSEAPRAQVVDRTGPAATLERPNLAHVEVIAQEDFGSAELAQVIGLARLPGQRDHVIAERGEHVDDQAADAAGRTGDEDRPVRRGQPVFFHAHDGQRSGKARCPERHRLEERQARRQRHDPLAGYPGELGIAAMMRHPDIETGRDDFVPGLEARVAALGDRTGKVDAGDAREAADDPSGTGCGQGVLVIDTGVRNTDGDAARIELRLVQRGKTAGHLAIMFRYKQGPEGIHRHPHSVEEKLYT
jgi:hypothetical protein